MAISRKSLKVTNASSIKHWDYTHAEVQHRPLLVTDFRIMTLASNEVLILEAYFLDVENWDKQEPVSILFGATALKAFVLDNQSRLPIVLKVGDMEMSKSGREYYTIAGLTDEEMDKYFG